MNRDEKIASIISYVDDNTNSIGAKRVCAMILGDKVNEIEEEHVRELHARLPRAKEEVINKCFNVIK